jgi:hypothetical protein
MSQFNPESRKAKSYKYPSLKNWSVDTSIKLLSLDFDVKYLYYKLRIEKLKKLSANRPTQDNNPMNEPKTNSK